MSQDDLKKIRGRIDSVDAKILELIKERAEIVKEVAAIKEAMDDPVYYRPEREAQILRDVMQKNTSLLSDKAVAQIFREIMAACLALEKKTTVAYLGPAGTYSQLAAEKQFGKSVILLPAKDIPDVFRAVTAREADYGVVPIENSTEGIVNATLDALLVSPLRVCGEIAIPIHQNLMRKNGDNSPLRRIYGHAQSIAQCRHWLAKHLPAIECIETSSNAVAAERAASEIGSAALGSSLAADIYELDITQASIQDSAENTTRFLVMGHNPVGPSGQDKTSLLIPTPHVPGALFHLLAPFAHHQVNLSLIASRPYAHRRWSYIFFVDILGHQDDHAVQRALTEIEQSSVMVTVLGSYPRDLGLIVSS